MTFGEYRPDLDAYFLIGESQVCGIECFYGDWISGVDLARPPEHAIVVAIASSFDRKEESMADD
jgi:hypothetical protein